MNSRKFCIILAGRNPEVLQEIRQYIDVLEVPEGFGVEVIVQTDTINRADAFQQAMKRSDAKYKLYVAEGVFPIHRRMLGELLEFFQSDSKLGIIGIAGAAYTPIEVDWRAAVERYGAYVERAEDGLVTHLSPSSDERTVPAAILSGYLLATQYDVDWDTELPDDAYLGEVQTMRFKQAGYRAGVPRSSEPWCLVDKVWANPDRLSEPAREWFMRQYAEAAFPKVSVLIPTYNRPDMFEQALRSALEQTYRHLEIIVGDDSTNDETQERIRPYLEWDPRIVYIRNERNLGQFENDLKLIELAGADFINFLMDDDLFDRRKIERMMKFMLDDREEKIALVTSYRKLIDGSGRPLTDQEFNRRLFEKDTRISGRELGDIILRYNWNCIGEPTTPLIRKHALRVPFGTFGGRRYGCNVDTSTWLSLLQHHDAIYLPDALSYFRIHGSQQLNSPRMALSGAADYAHELLTAPEYGYLRKKGEYRQALKFCIGYAEKMLAQHAEQREHFRELFNELETLLEQVRIRYAENSPKVSVLIPAYNRPHYLEVALQSALNQTYENIEIVISDDSTTDEVQEMLQPYLRKYPKIIYHRNDRPLVGENFNKCIELSSGEYINFLMDDDIFHPEKIERMIPYLLDFPNVKLVTSYRKYVDEEGKELPDEANKPIVNKDSIIEGKVLGNLMLSSLFNVIGEPTTVLFRRKDLVQWGTYNGRNHYLFINDLAAWIELLSRGDAAYLVQPLSYFRKHTGQNQQNPKYFYNNVPNWFDLIQDARKDGFLRNQRQYKMALRNYVEMCLSTAEFYGQEDAQHYVRGLGLENYVSQAYKLLLEEPDKYFCPLCGNEFEEFIPWDDKYDHLHYEYEMYNKHTAICPACLSSDRERFYKLYLERVAGLESGDNRVILHIAPELQLRKWLKGLPDVRYLCGDLFPQDNETLKVDITDIQFEEDTFDFILCSHVLEHVPKDRLAMREMYRVLKPNGFAIVNVPIVLNLERTHEDFTITSPEERVIHFGQEDHVRAYAKRDFMERLRGVGFLVEEFIYGDHLDVLPPARMIGLSDTDVLYIARKM
jgi:glycosyltransferase involved in cell wall biosynthesis/SAM-dependent methyltransferase